MIAGIVQRSRALAARPRAAGMTIVELMIAMGLLSILFVGLLQILDGSLRLWERTETRRELVDEGTAVLELLDQDFRLLANGPRGDLVCEWVNFDTTGDGARDTLWPRFRLVRHASPAELARLLPPDEPDDPGAAAPEIEHQGLVEVAWAVLPAHEVGVTEDEPDLRAEGVVWRGERLVGADGVSIFEDGYFRADQRPATGELSEVTGGVLWLGASFATLTTILHDGWTYGGALRDASTSWDAWRRSRPNVELTSWNAAPAGMPESRDRALLPRRVRFEIEVERAADLRSRTRLAKAASVRDTQLFVRDGARLPRGEGRFVRVGPEWMQLLDAGPDSMTVRRGMRGTLAVGHGPGEVVHWGFPLAREVPIPMHQEDWNL